MKNLLLLSVVLVLAVSGCRYGPSDGIDSPNLSKTQGLAQGELDTYTSSDGPCCEKCASEANTYIKTCGGECDCKKSTAQDAGETEPEIGKSTPQAE